MNVQVDLAPQQQATTHALLELATKKLTVDPAEPFYTHQDDFSRLAQTSGFTERNLSEGMMCLGVVSHPDVPNRIWKVTHTDITRDPYILYARWVFENRIWETNPHAPRIYEILESEHEQIAMICMEELSEFEWDEEPDYLRQDWFVARHAAFLENDCPDDEWPYESRNGYDDSHFNQPLSSLLSLMRSQFHDVPVYWDIHKKNVMKRGEIIVITDPFSPL